MNWGELATRVSQPANELAEYRDERNKITAELVAQGAILIKSPLAVAHPPTSQHVVLQL